jgi:hypothetical protein
MENTAHFKDSVCNLTEANQDTSKKAEDFVREVWISIGSGFNQKKGEK